MGRRRHRIRLGQSVGFQMDYSPNSKASCQSEEGVSEMLSAAYSPQRPLHSELSLLRLIARLEVDCRR